jgi:phosphonopyruvate decarboxylase
MEIPYKVITPETTNLEINRIIQETSMHAKKNSCPYALVVQKGSFKDYTLKDNSKGDFSLLREQAIKLIVDKLKEEDIVVSTTGVASRELFEYRETLGQSHEKDFLTVGGMGHANQIAMGIALQKPDRKIFCFDGDGAILMHMGSLAINGSTKCKNFKHIVFNNGAHDSVGGQPTVGYKIDITAIAKASGYSKVLQANNEDEIKNSLEDIYKHDGMSLLEVRVNKGFRKDLIRPTTTPLNNKRALMKFINK